MEEDLNKIEEKIEKEEETEYVLYCKINEITMTGTGEGVIIFSKDRPYTLDVSIKKLKEWEGKDVIIYIVPLRRKDNGSIQTGS